MPLMHRHPPRRCSLVAPKPLATNGAGIFHFSAVAFYVISTIAPLRGTNAYGSARIRPSFSGVRAEPTTLFQSFISEC
jgi:hypothetical protein